MHDDRLFSDDVGAIRATLVWSDSSGWTVAVVHAHGPTFAGACPPDRYERLTLGEALDVVDASVAAARGF